MSEVPPKREKRCWYCGEIVPAYGLPCGHGIYWKAKCPEHGWEPDPGSLERWKAKLSHLADLIMGERDD